MNAQYQGDYGNGPSAAEEDGSEEAVARLKAEVAAAVTSLRRQITHLRALSAEEEAARRPASDRAE
ncbi:hypothetical protein ACSNOI_35915 [Actinomadura kijaniata]|uniref:hypothetical protein n=1 Tax=Actinomadura kijaniata TaxID=46161 RepID=UPI003F1CE628